MGLTKCPRCELNYILDGGALCTVCRDEVRGNRAQEEGGILCSVCGEFPALPGEDMCKSCLSEIRYMEILSTDSEDDTVVEAAEIEAEPVSELDEIESVPLLDNELSDEADDEVGEESGETSIDLSMAKEA